MKRTPETLLDVVDELDHTIDLLCCVQTCMDVDTPPIREVSMSLLLIGRRLCQLRDATQGFVKGSAAKAAAKSVYAPAVLPVPSSAMVTVMSVSRVVRVTVAVRCIIVPLFPLAIPYNSRLTPYAPL